NRQQHQHFLHGRPENRGALRAEGDADPEILSPSRIVLQFETPAVLRSGTAYASMVLCESGHARTKRSLARRKLRNLVHLPETRTSRPLTPFSDSLSYRKALGLPLRAKTR